MIITIDGPAASGKSSIARKLAHDLGIFYLNTGLLYRAAAYLLITHTDFTDKELLALDHHKVELFFNQYSFYYSYDPVHKERIQYNNSALTLSLKTAEIDRAASLVSKNEHVRHFITNLQRSLAAHNPLVIDGRDCGTVVFPYADIKFFLTASLEARAVRWQADQARLGNTYTLEESYRQLKSRDESDMQRQHGPLRIPEDAFIIDNSTFPLAETVQIFLKAINQINKTGKAVE